MPHLHEIATVTSKGQITLPKSIRQALGITVGGKVAFDFSGSEVVVTRAGNNEHQDPSIGEFLNLLESSLKSGQGVGNMPDDLAQTMLANLHHDVDLHDEIVGEISL